MAFSDLLLGLNFVEDDLLARANTSREVPPIPNALLIPPLLTLSRPRTLLPNRV